VDARALGRVREHDLTRFLRDKAVPAFHTDVFDIIIYILGEWIGIELKENNRKQEKWNLTVHTNTWKNQMELARKTGMKRVVIYLSEHVGDWVIEDLRANRSKSEEEQRSINQNNHQKPNKNKDGKMVDHARNHQ